MIGKIASTLAQFADRESTIKKVNLDNLRFRIHVLLNFLLVLIFSLMVSLFTNTFKETLIGYLAFFLIRIISGGAWHFKSDLICFLFSSLVIISIPMIIINDYVQILLNYSSLLIFSFLSPVSKRIKVNTKSWWYFKFIGIGFILLNIFIFDSKLITVVYFIQTISLIKLGRGDQQ